MSSRQDLIRNVVWFSALKKAIGGNERGIRDALAVDLKNSSTEEGGVRSRTKDWTALSDDGQEMGVVQLIPGRVTATVTDEAEFLAWVMEEHPRETVRTVREAFKNAILKRVKETGEVIPGVEMRQGSDFVRVEPAKAAVEIIRTQLGVPELTAGGE